MKITRRNKPTGFLCWLNDADYEVHKPVSKALFLTTPLEGTVAWGSNYRSRFFLIFSSSRQILVLFGSFALVSSSASKFIGCVD